MTKVSTIGVVFNIFNIYFLILNRGKIRFTPLFSNLLILLACFDLLFLITGIGIFGLPSISNWYEERIASQIFPVWYVNITHIFLYFIGTNYNPVSQDVG